MDSVEALERDLHRWYKTFKAQLSKQERLGEKSSCLVCGKSTSVPDARPLTTCKFFQAGNCTRGAKCKFSHSTEVPESLEPQEDPQTATDPVVLTECAGCEAVVFCSTACQEQANQAPSPDDPIGLKSHSDLDCHELQLFAGCKDIIDEEELEKGVPQWLPYSDLAESFFSQPSRGWSSYAELRQMPEFSPPFMALVTDALSAPLTLVHALGQFSEQPPTQDCLHAALLLKEALNGGVLRIHLLGAEWEAEGAGEDKWMEVLHLLPSVQGLELTLVGPALPEESHGASSELHVLLGDEKEGRPYSLRFWRGNYEAFMLETDYSAPHLAVAFHSGLADFREDWRPALSPLVVRGVPLLFTHYHQHEAEFDLRTLKLHFNARVLEGHGANPYQSLLPIPDVFEGRVYYCNHFMTLVWGSQEGQAATNKRKGQDAGTKKQKRGEGEVAAEGATKKQKGQGEMKPKQKGGQATTKQGEGTTKKQQTKAGKPKKKNQKP